MLNVSEDYIKAGLHQAGCPTWLRPRELDVLMCVVPGPLGLGMSYAQTAELLDISKRTVTRTTQRIKIKYPSAWERVQIMRRTMLRHQKTLRQGGTKRVHLSTKMLDAKHIRPWSPEDMRCGIDQNYTGPIRLPD
jgi:alkylated DNA nucleotide flippase Atl1